MSDAEFKMAQLQLGQIYPIEDCDTVLEPDEARINLMSRTYLTSGQLPWLSNPI
jgi:hypothetical protein